MLAFLQCDYESAVHQLEQALSLYEELADRTGTAWCLTRLGSIARERGDYAAAEDLHRRAMAIAESDRDEQAIGAELNYLCFAAWLSGDLNRADSYADSALDRMTRSGDREGIIWALINSGTTARYRGDLVGAETLLQQAYELSAEISFREGGAWTQNQLGVVARLSGQFSTALQLQQASLAEHEQLGDRWRMSSVLDELAAIAVAVGDFRTAAAHLGAADRLRAEIAAPVPAVEVADRQQTLTATRDALGSAFRAAALAGGMRAGSMS